MQSQPYFCFHLSLISFPFLYKNVPHAQFLLCVSILLPFLFSTANPCHLSPQEMFISECVQFLTTRAPKPFSPAVSSGSERTGLTHEIVLTILACLNIFMR